MSRREIIPREDDGTSYANRVPQRQSLYDWAPGPNDENLYQELLSRANIPTFAQSARPQTRHLNFDRHRSSHSRPRIHLHDELADIPPSWAEAAEAWTPPHADSSTSTAALLQSVEQHRRFNARARSTLQNYILDRERRDNDPTPSAATWKLVFIVPNSKLRDHHIHQFDPTRLKRICGTSTVKDFAKGALSRY